MALLGSSITSAFAPLLEGQADITRAYS